MKRTVSVDPQVWAAVEAIAGSEHVGVSTVINRLLAHEVRLLAGIAAIAEYEQRAGAFTAAADRALSASPHPAPIPTPTAVCGTCGSP